MNFFIKIGVPSWAEAHTWGDYHFAAAMHRTLEQFGHQVTLQILPEWQSRADRNSDVTIHLLGLSRYRPKKGPLNVLWLISHPEMIEQVDTSGYDLIFIASRKLAEVYAAKIKVPVLPLLQFADTHHMYPQTCDQSFCELLFVGNSRNVHRQVIKDVLPTTHDLHVWGTLWEDLIPAEYIKGRYYPYENLRKLYSSCAILLNDHWDEMRQWDFVNNRVFDALACKAFIISDHVDNLVQLLGGSVVTYQDRRDLHQKIDYYLKHPDAREAKAEAGYAQVTARFGVDLRMQELLDKIQQAKPQRRAGKGNVIRRIKNWIGS